MTLHFRVMGVAQPKGSARAFVPKGWNRAIVTSANPKNKSWQDLVASEASRAIQQLPGGMFHILDVGVQLTVAFYLPRPKKFQKRGTDPQHLTKPDLDKLLRSVKDALKGVAWQDDSQVIDVVAAKRYAGVDETPHADIWIEPAKGVTLEREQPLFTDLKVVARKPRAAAAAPSANPGF